MMMRRNASGAMMVMLTHSSVAWPMYAWATQGYTTSPAKSASCPSATRILRARNGLRFGGWIIGDFLLVRESTAKSAVEVALNLQRAVLQLGRVRTRRERARTFQDQQSYDADGEREGSSQCGVPS